MGFKYETHLHTDISSKCGKSSPAEMVRFYQEIGFSGIFVTDHFYRGNTSVDKSLPWAEWVDRYADAWRYAKEEGDRIGLSVFFAWEESFHGEDFIIYGLSPEWLAAHPEMQTVTQEEQYALVHASGGAVVQAHPFRERAYMQEVKVHPHHADAFEIGNACNEYYQDRLAIDYAYTHHLHVTAGSDIHRAGMTRSGCIFGVETEKPLESGADYAELLKKGTGYRVNLPDGWLHGRKRLNPYFSVYEYDENGVRREIGPVFYPDEERAPEPKKKEKAADPEVIKETEEKKEASA